MKKSNRFLAHPAVVFTTLVIALVVGWIYWPAAQFQTQPANSEDSLRVLFVGNSYTQYNSLRGLFAALSKAGEKNVIVGEHIIFGSQLNQHLPKVKNKKLLDQGWNYVVLQEQSLIPTFEKLRNEKMLPAVREFDRRIRSTGGQTVLFMTWGRRDGAARFGEEVADYFSMQAHITAGIESIGRELDILVAPVGSAWEKVVNEKKDIQLWAKDGSHPAPAGSYLAACVFYAQLFDESPEGLTFTGALSEDDAKYLQITAAKTVFGEHNSTK